MAAVPSVGAPPAPPAHAVQRLYQDHGDRVLRFCRSRLRSRDEAEDARQVTYLNALRALRRGVVPECEIAWLLKIADNVCRTTRCSAARRSVEIPRDPHVLAAEVGAAGGDRDGMLLLPEALAALTEGQRRVVLLREWKGLSYREIAHELGMTQAAVESTLFRARRALADALGGETVTRARRRARGLDLGGLAGLKGLFGGGATAKLAAGVVAAVVLLPTASAPRPRPADAGPTAAASRAGAPADATASRPGGATRLAVPTPTRGTATRPAAPAARAPAVAPSPKPAAAPPAPRASVPAPRPVPEAGAAPKAGAAPGPAAVDPVTATVGVTKDAVETTAGTVATAVETTAVTVVETVEETAEPVLGTAAEAIPPATVEGAVDGVVGAVAEPADPGLAVVVPLP